MRSIRTNFLPSLTSLFLLSACENASAPAPEPVEDKQPPGASIRGIEWREIRTSEFHYFAGSFLTLILFSDSAVILEEKFTDVSKCAIEDADTLCSDFRWSNRYVGSYAIDDSLLTLSYAYTGTTANRLTEDEHVADGTTVLRYGWEAGNPLSLTLDGVGDMEVFPGRRSMELTAPVNADIE